MNTEVYEICLVPNGELIGFAKGYISGCQIWESWLTSLDDVDARFRELAEDNFKAEYGGYDDAWSAAMEGVADPDGDEARAKAEAAAEAACQEYADRCVKAHRIEWRNDLKWVCCRKMIEHGDGTRTFVEVV